jgi:hypothetical protein
MTRLTSLAKLRVPLGGQEIELQQIDFDGEGSPPLGGPEAGDTLSEGGAQRLGVPMRLLRTRIRENSRFTIFDIDPITAEAWGQALLDWAQAQPRG